MSLAPTATGHAPATLALQPFERPYAYDLLLALAESERLTRAEAETQLKARSIPSLDRAAKGLEEIGAIDRLEARESEIHRVEYFIRPAGWALLAELLPHLESWLDTRPHARPGTLPRDRGANAVRALRRGWVTGVFAAVACREEATLAEMAEPGKADYSRKERAIHAMEEAGLVRARTVERRKQLRFTSWGGDAISLLLTAHLWELEHAGHLLAPLHEEHVVAGFHLGVKRILLDSGTSGKVALLTRLGDGSPAGVSATFVGGVTTRVEELRADARLCLIATPHQWIRAVMRGEFDEVTVLTGPPGARKRVSVEDGHRSLARQVLEKLRRSLSPANLPARSHDRPPKSARSMRLPGARNPGISRDNDPPQQQPGNNGRKPA